MTNGKIKFNHEMNASKTKDANQRPVLVQNGIMFTNAEFNRFSNKFEPEPIPIAPHEPMREMLTPKIISLIEQVQNLNDQMNDLIEPIKMVLATEKIMSEPTMDAVIQEKEFKRLNKINFQNWVEKNKERIAVLEPEDEVLGALIDKWENFYPEQAFVV